MAGVSSNSEQRRAVLIGCPVGVLKGIETDLRVMESLLAKHGFTSTKAYPATKADIFAAWHKVIDQTKPGDAVVIYYSGHGGLSPLASTEKSSGKGDDSKKPLHLQYLIPVDFDDTKEGDWRGITTAELSELLRLTTDRTENVTLILDCCHSARMARQRGIVKQIDPADYGEVLKHIDKMLREGKLREQQDERNQHVLCIAAAAETDFAYEQDFGPVRRGVLTEALEKALASQIRDDAEPTRVSWRSIMLRIRDRMKKTCPQQYPQVEGDDLRFAFSLERADLYGAIPVSINDGDAILGGGDLQGLKEGDVYAVLPFDQESLDPSKQIAEVVVEFVRPTVSIGRFEGVSTTTLPPGAKAFPKKRALGKMPVSVRGSGKLVDRLRSLSDSSKLFRIIDEHDSDDQGLLATVTFESSRLSVESHEGNISYLLAEWHFGEGREPSSEIAECVAQLESLARARHVLTLEGETGPDAISTLVDIEFGVVRRGQCEPSGATLAVHEGEKIYLKIHNISTTTVYVSIFDVSSKYVALLTGRGPSGEKLLEDKNYIYGYDEFRGKVVGKSISWPDTTPKVGDIPETLVVLVADDKIDNLRGLESTWNSTQRGSGSQQLGDMINDLASRSSRMAPPDSERPKILRFGVRRFHFQLKPSSSSTSKGPTEHEENLTKIPIQTQNLSLSSLKDKESGQDPVHNEKNEIKLDPIPAANLPAPEAIEGWENVPGPSEDTGAKGVFGRMSRIIAGVPPCVRVINQHTEEITVVVSKYRPNLLITGGGLNASATGAGLNFSATTFLSPATKKTLAPQATDPERCEAVFPLWGRMEGFGVISIFTGPDKVLYIENDQVPLGATVHFSYKPNLAITPYKQPTK